MDWGVSALYGIVDEEHEMNDYISRDELFDALYGAEAITFTGMKIIHDFPAADVRPVVLCRDCKYRQYDALFKQSYCNGQRVTDDWFCADGERLTNCGAWMEES